MLTYRPYPIAISACETTNQVEVALLNVLRNVVEPNNILPSILILFMSSRCLFSEELKYWHSSIINLCFQQNFHGYLCFAFIYFFVH